jgi:hypothetical protein
MTNNNLVRIYSSFLFILLVGCFHTGSFAQGNASASINSPVSARITEPIGISKSIHSFYGSGAVIFSFIVEITPNHGGQKGFGGSITLPVTTGVITAAFFPISGFEGYTFTVFLPSSPLMIHNGTNEMLVTSLTSEPALGTDPDMIAGVFVSVTPTNVIVNYN